MSVDVRAKLAEKGITLPVATKPLAAYVPAVRTGNIVFTAGQLPMVDGAIAKTGKVGDEVTVEEAYELAKICAINALAAVELVAPVDSIVKVVRIVCYVNGALSASQQLQMEHLSSSCISGEKQALQLVAHSVLQSCR
jgi:enamine deaminase RidA (YjgF/YER057c/UK114 family)